MFDNSYQNSPSDVCCGHRIFVHQIWVHHFLGWVDNRLAVEVDLCYMFFH